MQQRPDCLHAYRAHCIRLNQEGTEALPYLEWGPGITTEPSNLNFYTSSMGEIYNPDFLRTAKNVVGHSWIVVLKTTILG